MLTPRALAFCGVLWVASDPQATPVRVTVVESTTAAATTYSYRVYNGSAHPVVSLTIGLDPRSGESQLRTAPLGWTPERGLPASSATSPRGWTARVVTTEESDLVEVAWSSDAGPQWDIAPGTTVAGFSVKVPGRSAEYRTAHFQVILGNGTLVSGSPEPDRGGRN
jgi:hypothetical protein